MEMTQSTVGSANDRQYWTAGATNVCLHPQTIALALIGSPGSGKSETANTLFGKKSWKTAFQSERVTEEIQTERINKKEINLTVIDTPGFLSTDNCFSIMKEIDSRNMKNLIFGITFRIGRTTEEEITVFHKHFSTPKIWKYLKHRTFFIFTNTDELEDIDNDLSDIGMLGYESLDQKFNNWLVKSPKIKYLLECSKFKYCAISNRLELKKRNEESDKLVEKIKETFLECQVNGEIGLDPNADFSYNGRLDESLLFSVQEIRDILSECHEILTLPFLVPDRFFKNQRIQAVSKMIHKKFKDKGSTLTEKEIQDIFGYEASKCIIF